MLSDSEVVLMARCGVWGCCLRTQGCCQFCQCFIGRFSAQGGCKPSKAFIHHSNRGWFSILKWDFCKKFGFMCQSVYIWQPLRFNPYFMWELSPWCLQHLHSPVKKKKKRMFSTSLSSAFSTFFSFPISSLGFFCLYACEISFPFFNLYHFVHWLPISCYLLLRMGHLYVRQVNLLCVPILIWMS